MWKKDHIEFVNGQFSFWAFVHLQSKRETELWNLLFFSGHGRQAFLWSGLVKELNLEADQPPRPDLFSMVFENSKIQAVKHELELSRPTK